MVSETERVTLNSTLKNTSKHNKNGTLFHAVYCLLLR